MESNQEQNNLQGEGDMDLDDGETPNSILQGSEGRESKKKEKPHVTWDEEQIAEHNKTRGQKMKIDEPKTPYVTDEEFKTLCMADPDYVKEMGLDIDSQEAINDVLSDKDVMDDMAIAEKNMKINAQINSHSEALGGHNSDDELQSPKKNSLQMGDYFDGNFAKSTKKNCESSMNVANNRNLEAAKQGQLGGGGLGGIDFGDLNSKLEQLHDDEEDAAQKKAEFDKKRQQHYKNEFQMAKLLKQKQEMEEDEEDDEEQQL